MSNGKHCDLCGGLPCAASSRIAHKTQAARCLTSAAKSVVHLPGGDQPIRFGWACENNPLCQGVLARTYGCCVAPDVLKYKPHEAAQYCATHSRQCPTLAGSAGQGNLIALMRLHVCVCKLACQPRRSPRESECGRCLGWVVDRYNV